MKKQKPTKIEAHTVRGMHQAYITMDHSNNITVYVCVCVFVDHALLRLSAKWHDVRPYQRWHTHTTRKEQRDSMKEWIKWIKTADIS